MRGIIKINSYGSANFVLTKNQIKQIIQLAVISKCVEANAFEKYAPPPTPERIYLFHTGFYGQLHLLTWGQLTDPSIHQSIHQNHSKLWDNEGHSLARSISTKASKDTRNGTNFLRTSNSKRWHCGYATELDLLQI